MTRNSLCIIWISLVPASPLREYPRSTLWVVWYGSLHCTIKNFMEFIFRIRHDSEFAMFWTRLHKGIANIKLDHDSYKFYKDWLIWCKIAEFSCSPEVEIVNLEGSVHFFRGLCFRKWRISKGFRSAKDIIHEVKNCFLTRCLARIVLSAPQSCDFTAKPLKYWGNCYLKLIS